MSSEHSIDQTKQLIHFGKSWLQADRSWTADQLVAVLRISKFVTVRHQHQMPCLFVTLIQCANPLVFILCTYYVPVIQCLLFLFKEIIFSKIFCVIEMHFCLKWYSLSVWVHIGSQHFTRYKLGQFHS